MRPHIDVLGSKNFFGSGYGQTFRYIHIYTAAVIALPGISFSSIPPGRKGSLRLEYGTVGVISRSDKIYCYISPLCIFPMVLNISGSLQALSGVKYQNSLQPGSEQCQ